ncbi:MAG TPA: alkaline phosphatase family protein [Chloroflexota bacterium]
MLTRRLTRRKLLAATSASAALGLIAAVASPSLATAAPLLTAQQASLPPPDQSGIEHIVLVMMENRSFDHFLGWLPDHDGQQAGLQYTDASGASHPTHALAPDFQGCGFHDPDHSFSGGRVEYNDGQCDGWLRAGTNDLFSIGYYTQPDLPFLGQIAPSFVTPARYFAAILGPTFPNRIYAQSAQTDRLSNTSKPSTLPTIWDRLGDAGVSGAYYYNDLSILSLWGSKYTAITLPISNFLQSAADGSLPAVAYVDPAFNGGEGTSETDDHPLSDVRDGEAFLNSVYSAVTGGPAWPRTFMIITFDEWGGFFDHIPPPVGTVTPAEQALGYTDGLRGFRVPCVVVSPWSQQSTVTRTVFDHTSILKLIEWRFGLTPLTMRDAQANNLAEVLDFANPRLDVPQPQVPAGPFGGTCA